MSYIGTIPKDLDYTKPDGASEYKSILDDAIRELKTVFQNDHKIRSTATGVTVATTDSIILCTDTLSITLPTASTLAGNDPNGVTRIKAFRIMNTGTGTVTITGTVIVAGTSTSNPTLSAKEDMLIWTDGTSYYGNISTEASTFTMTGETSATSASALVSIDLGTVKSGDRIFVQGGGVVTTVSGQYANMTLSKSAGTSTGVFIYDMDSISIQLQSPPSSILTDFPMNISGVWQVTGNGSLTLRINCGGYSGTTYTKSQIYAFFLKKK